MSGFAINSKSIFEGYWIPYLTFGILWMSSCFDPFFWDTIQLSSRQAHYFYEQTAFNLILPHDIDSGHFPLMGIYLSAIWNIFGKSLFVSHLAMIPWIVLLAFSLHRLVRFFIPSEYRIYTLLILSLEPTLLAQIALVSPDVILMACFTCFIYCYYRNVKVGMLLSFLVLSLISMRGAMVAGILCVTSFFMEWHAQKKSAFRKWFFILFPALIVNISFLIYHYAQKQWIGFHSDSPWSESFQLVNMQDMVKKLAIYLWRLVDFGRIGIWLLLGMVLIHRKKISFNKESKWFATLGIGLFFWFLIVATVFHGLSSHRYFLPLYFVVAFMTLILFTQSQGNRERKKGIMLFVSLLLLSGHFWKYPDHVAKGWDASLSFKPVFDLHETCMKYMDKQNISPNEVSSFFPFLAKEKYVYLNNNNRQLIPFPDTSKYLLLSNVTNDAPDSLFTVYPWQNALYFVEKGSIKMGIFERKK